MHAADVIPRHKETNRHFQVLQLFRESVGQACEPSQVHPDREIGAFDMRRGNPFKIRIANDGSRDRGHDMRRWPERAELKRLTPRDEKGRAKNRLFQWLAEDVGHLKLREHLASIIALMRAADDWETFERMLNRALPRYGDLPLFDGLWSAS
jgi:hypothetical protein